MVSAIFCSTVQTKGCLHECLQKASVTEANTWPVLDKCFLQYLPSCSDFSARGWKSDLWFDLRRQILEPPAAANAASQQRKMIWHTPKLLILQEQELSLRALQMQTSDPGLGQSKTFSNLTRTKNHKTYLAMAKVTCWVIWTGGGNFLEHQGLPYLSHSPYQWENSHWLQESRAGLGWALLKFHLNTCNWKTTAGRSYTFPKPRA